MKKGGASSVTEHFKVWLNQIRGPMCRDRLVDLCFGVPLVFRGWATPWYSLPPLSRKVSTRIVRLEELVGVCVTVAAYKKGAQWNLVNKCPLCYRLVTLQGWVVKIKNQAWNPQSHLLYNSQFKDQWVCVVCVCVLCLHPPPPRPPALVALSPLFHP